MTGFQVYKLYLALKLHFTTESYDFIKNKGRTKAKYSTFDNRPDKWMFVKLADSYTKEYIFDLFLSMLVHKDTIYVGDITLNIEQAAAVYRSWKKRISRMSSVLADECQYVLKKANEHKLQIVDMFRPTDKYGQLPLVIQMYIRGKISIETLVILEKVFHFIERCGIIIKGDDMWETVVLRIQRYQPFLRVDSKLAKYKEIIRNVFLQNKEL